MKLLGTVGLPGSGKSEAAAVARAAGVPVVTMGDVIRDECRNRGLDPAQHHGEMAKTLREEGGPGAIAKRSLPEIESALSESASETALVDGLRSPAEVDRFEAAFGDAFVLVSVEAPFETRAERLADRERDASDADREALRDREERELGFGMGDVMDRADVRIENTGSLAAFRERIRGLLDVPATPELEAKRDR
ncbi:AAA family ATPase [Haloplanus sp.]|uniref:AAA family ATPase n=1 Tax=Haloplanus sp. TaxID=1961696 RepID=UPI00262AFF49|nr:AAA family ATPase [Haloplanus sp.]